MYRKEAGGERGQLHGRSEENNRLRGYYSTHLKCLPECRKSFTPLQLDFSGQGKMTGQLALILWEILWEKLQIHFLHSHTLCHHQLP